MKRMPLGIMCLLPLVVMLGIMHLLPAVLALLMTLVIIMPFVLTGIILSLYRDRRYSAYS